MALASDSGSPTRVIQLPTGVLIAGGIDTGVLALLALDASRFDDRPPFLDLDPLEGSERLWNLQRNVPRPCWLIFQVDLLVWESRMTFRQFALPLAVLIALSADVLGQETAGRSAGPDDGQRVFNNACRTCHTLREG